MKEYRSPEIFKTPISSSVAYEGLDLGIEPFASGVGDWIHAIIEKAIEVPFKHVRCFGQRAELKPAYPTSPVVEERQRLASVAEAPELREGVFGRPGLGYLQTQVLHDLEHFPVVVVPALRRAKEEILRTLEVVLPLAGKLLVLGFSDAVHRFVQMLGDVESVVHHDRFRSLQCGGSHERRPHVHGHCVDLPGIDSERVEQGLGGFAVAILHNFQHPRLVQVGHDRGVAVASPKGLLVDPHAPDRPLLAPAHSASDRPIHNALELVVAERKQGSSLLERAACSDRFDGQSLEEQSEPRARFGPGNPDRLHAAFGAIHSRGSTDDHRLELHRVEMAPSALRSVVVDIAARSAIRAARLLALWPINRNGNAAFTHAKIHIAHLPWRSKAQKKAVMLIQALAAVVAHAIHILNQQFRGKFTLKPLHPLKTQKNQKNNPNVTSYPGCIQPWMQARLKLRFEYPIY